MDFRFEWDAAKAASNFAKHRISFDLAMHAFADPFAFVRQDRIEGGEYRWQTIGMVDGRLLVLVAHTIRDESDGSEVIRIISARRATAQERKRYEQESR
tara:strand:- start:1376 stop:1672 length:297 start_codon:yes stop_codon:yes gene_type:complete